MFSERAAGHGALYTTQMRAILLLWVLAPGCWTSAQPTPAPPVPETIESKPSCNEAAIGIERSTRDLRPAGAPIAGPLRARCTEDHWAATAIECFAHMGEDDLGRCAALLETKTRDKLFDALGNGGTTSDRAELAIDIAKLQSLRVGIPECDNFVIAVGRILACNEMPLAARVQLGNETVDFWSLPNNGRLPADAIKRMATVCDQTRGELEQRAVGAGCKL